jgi:hypothetical protein
MASKLKINLICPSYNLHVLQLLFLEALLYIVKFLKIDAIENSRLTRVRGTHCFSYFLDFDTDFFRLYTMIHMSLKKLWKYIYLSPLLCPVRPSNSVFSNLQQSRRCTIEPFRLNYSSSFSLICNGLVEKG